MATTYNNNNKYQDYNVVDGKQVNKTTAGERTDTTVAGERTDTSATSSKGFENTATNSYANRAYENAPLTANLITDPTKLGYSAEQFDKDKLLSLYNQAAQTQYDTGLQAYDQAINQYGRDLNNAQNSYIAAMRQANANAIASGAARGTQAANELSTMLGLQQQGVAGATDLATQRANLGLDYAKALSEAQVNSEAGVYNRQNNSIDQMLTKYASDEDTLGMLLYNALGSLVTSNTNINKANNDSSTNTTGKQVTTNTTGEQTTTEELGEKTTTTDYGSIDNKTSTKAAGSKKKKKKKKK